MKQNKKLGTGSSLLGLMLIVGGLIAGIILVMQPQLLDEKAAGLTYRTPTPTPIYRCGSSEGCLPENCHCVDEDACTHTVCQPDIRHSCDLQSRSWCLNMHQHGYICCPTGYVCGRNGVDCVK